jgi:hypothetical protein
MGIRTCADLLACGRHSDNSAPQSLMASIYLEETSVGTICVGQFPIVYTMAQETCFIEVFGVYAANCINAETAEVEIIVEDANAWPTGFNLPNPTFFYEGDYLVRIQHPGELAKHLTWNNGRIESVVLKKNDSILMTRTICYDELGRLVSILDQPSACQAL